MKTASILTALLALLCISPAFAGAAPVGKLTSVEGRVDITSPGKAAKPVKVGDTVNVGDILRTKSKSKCEVTFGDGNILRLAESTRLKITTYMFGKGPRNEILNLFRGKIQNIVQKVTGADADKAGRYEIHTPTAVCGVRGTNFFSWHQSGISGALFKEGVGYGYSINRPQDIRTINPGQAMTVRSANRPPTVRPATPQELDQHQKDTAPAKKEASGDGKDGEKKKTDSLTAKSGGSAGPDKKDEKKTDDSSPAGENGNSNSASGAPAGFGAGAGESDGGNVPGGLPLANLLPDSPPGGTAPTDNKPNPVLNEVVVPFERGDTTPPVISFTATPSSPTGSAAATFGLASTEANTTFRYSTDGVNYADAAGSAINLSGLAEGGHTLYVKGTDTAGNTSAPLSYAWTTDYTAPTITLSGTPAAVTNAGTADFGVTASEQATFTYALNGQTVASPALTNLREGSNTFTVRATDAAGNESTRTYAWTTDYTAPTITLSGTPAAVTNAGTADFGVTASEQATFTYALNGQTVASPALTNLREGSNTFTVRATDAAGNESTRTYAWTTDYTAPTVSFSATPSALTNSTAAAFSAASSETGMTYRYSTDGVQYTDAAGSAINLSGLTEGRHTLYVKGTDGAGNESAAVSYAWTTDYTAPTITLSGTPAFVTNAGTADFGVTASEQVTFTYALNGQAVASTTFTNLREGSNTFTVRATDAAGNESTRTYAWTTDYTAPTITLTPEAAPLADVTPGTKVGGVKVGLAGSETAVFSSTLDGGTPVAGSSLDLLNVSTGSHTLQVRATDGAGNTATQNLSFDLARYALAGAFSGIDSDGVPGDARGEVAGIPGRDWGGWKLDMTGLGSTTPSASWTGAAGGQNTDGSYWLDVIPGTTNTDARTLAGESQLTYLSRTVLGQGTGIVTGQYDNAGQYSIADAGSGSYTEKPLKFMSQFSGNLINGSSGLERGPIGNTPVTITLTWGSTPYDLDAHLWVPPQNNSNNIEIFYANMGATDRSPFAGLDQDVIKSPNGPGPYPPETMTISRLRNKRYYYSVHNYSGSPDINASNARVVIADGSGHSYTYTVPTTGSGVWYNVFYLENDMLFTINTIGATSAYEASLTGESGSILSSYSATLGGADSLWGATAPVPFTVLGTYIAPDSTKRYVFQNEIYSYNATTLKKTTYDGGAYAGWMSGIIGDGSGAEGMIYAFHREPAAAGASSMGIIKGTFSGSTYPEIGIWQADGSFDPPLSLGTTTLLPENLQGEILSTALSYKGSDHYNLSSGIMADATGQTVNTISLPLATNLNFHRLAALPQIGLWETQFSGTTGSLIGTPTTYEMEIVGADPAAPTSPTEILFTGALTPNAAQPPTNYKLDGTAAGSWMDINGVLNGAGIPSTGVIGGALLGTFDPAAQTVRAATMGAWVETGKFLQMAGDATTTETANATLRALNIPAVQVGKANLAGSSENGMNITMNNVIFFANSTGGTPRIWATNNVAGTYNTSNSNSYSGTLVPLSGNGLSAAFSVQTWDQTNGKWHSTVTNGQGIYSGTGAMNGTSVDFHGAAAGTMAGGALTGTAAGRAKIASPALSVN